MLFKDLKMGNPSKISQFFLAVKHSRRTYFFTMTKVRLEEALTELIPKSTKKIFHAEATGFTVITNPFPSFLTCAESTKCLRPHVPKVTFRLLFVALSCQMTLSDFLIPCIYVTKVVKQKCSERC